MICNGIYVAWAITSAILLAWAITMTALYLKERGHGEDSHHGGFPDLFTLELSAPSVGMEARPSEGRVLLHLEEVYWHGHARITQDGVSQHLRKITRDTIVGTLNETLASKLYGVQAVLYEVPSPESSIDPATVHLNFSVAFLSEVQPSENITHLSLELYLSDEERISGQFYPQKSVVEHLKRPFVVQFVLPISDFPDMIACVKDSNECSAGWTSLYDPAHARMEDEALCSPRVIRYKPTDYNPDPQAIGVALLRTGITLLGMIPGASIPAALLGIAVSLSNAFMSSKTGAEQKWEEIRKYVEKYVAREIKEAVDDIKIRELQNAMVGIAEVVSDYYAYPNGTDAKGRSFYAVKAAMANWYGFFTDVSNPVGSLPFIIPYGTSYLSWRLQEILAYEEINGEPLTQETRDHLVESLKAAVEKLQAMPTSIIKSALEVRKKQIRFEKKNGIFHCSDRKRPWPPWTKECGNIKLLDDATGWTSKAYFFAHESEDDPYYHYVHTVLYNMAIKKATFLLQLSLEDYMDAASFWSGLVPNTTYTAVNATNIYQTGLVGNLESKKAYIDEQEQGGNLTRLKAWSNGEFLDGLQLWFHNASQGVHGHTFDEGDLPSETLENLHEDYIDKVCGVVRVNTACSTQSSIRGVHIANNATKITPGSMVVDQYFEGWTFDYDVSATISPAYLCGLKLGLFGPSSSLEHIDVLDLTFCRNTTRLIASA